SSSPGVRNDRRRNGRREHPQGSVMFRTKHTRLAVTLAAATVFITGVAVAAGQVAQAHNDPPPRPPVGTANAGTLRAAGQVAQAPNNPSPAPPVDTANAGTFLAAVLDGRHEVPVPG